MMGFQIHLRVKDNELLLLTLLIRARIMVAVKVRLKGVIVHIVLRILRVSPVAKMASFMLVSAVDIKFIVAIESLPAKAAFWVTFEAALILGAWNIIAKLLVLAQLVLGK